MTKRAITSSASCSPGRNTAACTPSPRKPPTPPSSRSREATYPPTRQCCGVGGAVSRQRGPDAAVAVAELLRRLLLLHLQRLQRRQPILERGLRGEPAAARPAIDLRRRAQRVRHHSPGPGVAHVP